MKEIGFPFQITGKNFDEKEKRLTVGFPAILTINRRAYGVNYTQPM